MSIASEQPAASEETSSGSAGASPSRCVCPMAGYCERHGVTKVEPLWKLCRAKPHYFQAWEDGRGPGQRSVVDKASQERRARIARRVAYIHRVIGWLEFFAIDGDRGVGDVYARMISRAGRREVAAVLADLASRYACCGRDAVTNLNLRHPLGAAK